MCAFFQSALQKIVFVIVLQKVFIKLLCKIIVVIFGASTVEMLNF